MKSPNAAVLLLVRRAGHQKDTPASRFVSHRRRCQDEVTRDVIFLLQRRIGSCWSTESVWLDRREAERSAARSNGASYKWKTWRVYGIPAEGDLARILRGEKLTARRR